MKSVKICALGFGFQKRVIQERRILSLQYGFPRMLVEEHKNSKTKIGSQQEERYERTDSLE